MKELAAYPVPGTSVTIDGVADYSDFHIDAVEGALCATVFIYDRKVYENGTKDVVDTQTVKLSGNDYLQFLGSNPSDVDVLGKLIWGLFGQAYPATFGVAPDYTPPVK